VSSQNGTIHTKSVEGLRIRLRGSLLRPGEEGYGEACAAWNLNAHQRPAVAVVAEGAADVVAAVRFAREAGLGLGVMATGHGVGAPADGGLLINTSRMRGVRVDPVARTARVEAGALWKDVIPAAHDHGLAGLAGSAPHVGVVGYTMGGGFGWLGRKYGLNSASVTEANVVTARGELLRASADENADLFWGLKGGGGNFGIVTSLEFRLYPLTRVYGGSIFYPVERAPEVLDLYSRWSEGLPDEMTTAVTFMNIPPLPHIPEPLRGRSVVVVKGCYCGERSGSGEEMFRPVREGIGEPIIDTFREMPVSEMDRISMDPVDPLGVIQRAELLSDLSPRTIDALLTVAGAGSGSPLTILEIRQLGGALARTAGSPSPMGNGEARFSMNAIGATFTPEMARAVKAHIALLLGATRPYQTGETFLNFMEENPTRERVSAAYPPEDWERLVDLKDEHDPHNLFRFNRNIPPSRVGPDEGHPGERAKTTEKRRKTMKKVLVTGATGNVGSRVILELLERGVPVRALVRDQGKASEMLGDGVELTVGDFGDPESLLRALEGVESVFLACANQPRQVEYETRVIDAARDMGAGRIVKLSALGTERGSSVAFWDWHARIEAHLRASGIPSVVLRPSFSMANLLASAEAVQYTGKLFAPAGDARISMIHPRDVGAAAAVALVEDGHEGETYTLTGPEAITFEGVAKYLSEAVGREIEYLNVPDEAARQSMTEQGLPEFVAAQIVTVFGVLRQGAQARPTGTVQDLTGHDPRALADFARENAHWFAPPAIQQEVREKAS
jgi:uncharacterized protein YbjT (DUF2867 family)